MPIIRKLKFDMSTNTMATWHGSDPNLVAKQMGPGSSSVTKISLLNLEIRFSDFKFFINASPRLEELKITWHMLEALSLNHDNLEGFNSALCPLAARLEKLTTYYPILTKSDFVFPSDGRLHCLSKFTRLRVLRLAWLLFSVLPMPSLNLSIHCRFLSILQIA